MSHEFRSMQEAVSNLCSNVWKAYEEDWHGRYIANKVLWHQKVCERALINYCEVNHIDFKKHFDIDHIIINTVFQDYKNSTRVLFDDIPNLETKINRDVFITGICYWLVEHTDDYFFKNDINKARFDDKEG